MTHTKDDLVERLHKTTVFTYDEFTEKGAKHHNALLEEAATRITELEQALQRDHDANVLTIKIAVDGLKHANSRITELQAQLAEAREEATMWKNLHAIRSLKGEEP